jgi:hypothetical protein
MASCAACCCCSCTVWRRASSSCCCCSACVCSLCVLCACVLCVCFARPRWEVKASWPSSPSAVQLMAHMAAQLLADPQPQPQLDHPRCHKHNTCRFVLTCTHSRAQHTAQQSSLIALLLLVCCGISRSVRVRRLRAFLGSHLRSQECRRLPVMWTGSPAASWTTPLRLHPRPIRSSPPERSVRSLEAWPTIDDSRRGRVAWRSSRRRRRKGPSSSTRRTCTVPPGRRSLPACSPPSPSTAMLWSSTSGRWHTRMTKLCSDVTRPMRICSSRTESVTAVQARHGKRARSGNAHMLHLSLLFACFVSRAVCGCDGKRALKTQSAAARTPHHTHAHAAAACFRRCILIG